MNREQRRLVNEVLCSVTDTDAWMLDATLVMHGRWNRKSKPFAIGHLRPRRHFRDIKDWESLQNLMPLEEIELCFALNGAVLFYETPGFSQDEMISHTVDKLAEISLDEEFAKQVHDRFIKHVYGASSMSREFRRNRVCLCAECSRSGEFPLEGRKGWRVMMIALINIMDLSKALPQEIMEAVGRIRWACMQEVSSPLDAMLIRDTSIGVK